MYNRETMQFDITPPQVNPSTRLESDECDPLLSGEIRKIWKIGSVRQFWNHAVESQDPSWIPLSQCTVFLTLK